MRRAYSNRRRQKLFNNSYNVNEKLLPTYNALQDPFLEGFFDRPQLKRHLNSMSLFKKQRKKCLNFQQHIGQAKSNKFKQKIPILPLEYIMANEQRTKYYEQPKTASTGRRIRIVAKSMLTSRHDKMVIDY